MLAAIREKVQGWIAGIILGLIAIPFALWGINYYFEGGQLNVAEVDGTAVSVDSYRRALDNQKRSLQQMLGRDADSRLFESPEFKQRVLDGLIDEILVAAGADAAGYRLSDAELARSIREAPSLQRDGQFDRGLYEAFVRSRGMDARGFEAALRRDFLVRQAESGYAQSAIVTPTEIETLLRLQNQQREAAYAVLRPERVRDRVKVAAEAIEQEYQANAERYRTPERVRIEYLRLAAEDIARDIRLSDEEIRQALADSAQAASAQEQRRASHILVKLPGQPDDAAEKAAMARLQGLRAKLLAGGDFAALARQHSEDPGSKAQGGDLGFVSRGAFVKEFEQALYALRKPGELSAPVRTQYGLHLIKLTGIQKATAGVDRAKVVAELRTRKAEERFIDLSERFHNLVYEQSDSLKPAAETLGLRIETSGWFTRAGSPGGITAERKIVDAAFDSEVLEQGRNSQAIEIGRNVLVALRIAAREPARQRPLAEVRADIEKQLFARAQQAEVERIAQAAVQELAAGKGLEAVARQYGMDYQPARRFGRRQAGVDAQLIEALFKAAHPDGGRPVHGSTPLAGAGYAVFELKAVIEPDKATADAADTTGIRRALEARRGRDYYDSYRAGLRERAKVKLYKDQL